jgi:hypothetical protein
MQQAPAKYPFVISSWFVTGGDRAETKGWVIFSAV